MFINIHIRVKNIAKKSIISLFSSIWSKTNSNLIQLGVSRVSDLPKTLIMFKPKVRISFIQHSENKPPEIQQSEFKGVMNWIFKLYYIVV